jgi:hypothetical protein
MEVGISSHKRVLYLQMYLEDLIADFLYTGEELYHKRNIPFAFLH